MIGLSILIAVFAYILLAKFIVNQAYKYTGKKIVKNIALAIMILIPTWDIIIGYPIYKYLCFTKAGVHIYKTVDNVEGFYVGEQDKAYEPVEIPKGYKYVDYKEIQYQKPTGKYYRSYWVDNNTSKDCVHYGQYKYGSYAKAFRSGRCIVKKEIPESEVSRWRVNYLPKVKLINIFGLGISINKVGQIIDNKSKEILSKQITVNWNNGWLMSLFTSIERGHPKIIFCGIDYSNVYELVQKTLKSKTKGEK